MSHKKTCTHTVHWPTQTYYIINVQAHYTHVQAAPQVGRWISSSWPPSVPAQMLEPQAANDVILRPEATKCDTVWNGDR